MAWGGPRTHLTPRHGLPTSLLSLQTSHTSHLTPHTRLPTGAPQQPITPLLAYSPPGSTAALVVRASKSSRCFAVRFCGTLTWKCTYWWPLPRPLTSGTPRPCISRRSPGCVAAGTLSVTGPSTVGTRTDEPRAASAVETRTLTCTSLPSRSKTGWSRTLITTYSVPLPPLPVSPLPCSRRFIPESTPAGMSTISSRSPEVGERHATVFLQPLTACRKSSETCACTS
eukprot:scaffold91451_cov48-Phaeocystis_antarctica.AAC.1